jgi:hypothetical protein
MSPDTFRGGYTNSISVHSMWRSKRERCGVSQTRSPPHSRNSISFPDSRLLPKLGEFLESRSPIAVLASGIGRRFDQTWVLRSVVKSPVGNEAAVLKLEAIGTMRGGKRDVDPWLLGVTIEQATSLLIPQDRNVSTAGIKSSPRLPAFGNNYTPDVSLSATGMHEERSRNSN